MQQQGFQLFTEECIPEYTDYYNRIKLPVSSWLNPSNLIMWENHSVTYGKVIGEFYCNICVEEDEEDDRESVKIPLGHLFENEGELSVRLSYPAEALKENVSYEYEDQKKILTVTFKKRTMARMFEIVIK